MQKLTAKYEPVKGMITASLSPKTVLNVIVVAHTIIICGAVDGGHHCCHTQDSEFEQSNWMTASSWLCIGLVLTEFQGYIRFCSVTNHIKFESTFEVCLPNSRGISMKSKQSEKEINNWYVNMVY